MDTKVRPEHEIPEFDYQIADWIAKQPNSLLAGPTKTIGVSYGKIVFRTIECYGVHEFTTACEYLRWLGMFEIVPFRGLDAIFSMG